MRPTDQQRDGSNIFLTATILLANLDYSGLLDYALKALIGGAIWFGCKITADHISQHKQKKS